MPILALFLTALFSAGGSACRVALAAKEATGNAVRIGGAFALTGGGSELDVPSANGAKLALRQINAAGGVLGRPVELIIRDSEYKAKEAEEITKELVEKDKVSVLIGFNDTDSVLAAGPVAQAAGIPFIAVGASSPRLPAQIGDTLFLACFGDNAQASAGAEYAFKKFGKKAYLLLDKSMEYTTLLAGYFKSHFTDLGGGIVLEDEFSDQATDISEQIAKLKALTIKPDFYYIAAMPYNVVSVIEQMRKAGMSAPIVGGDGYDTPDLLKLKGSAAKNVFFTTHALMSPSRSTEGIKKFMAAYKRMYAREPENGFAALGYDAMNLAVDAVRRAGSTQPQAIKKALEETRNFPGITGSISFSPQSHIPEKPVAIIALKGGKFTPAGQVVPKKVPAP